MSGSQARSLRSRLRFHSIDCWFLRFRWLNRLRYRVVLLRLSGGYLRTLIVRLRLGSTRLSRLRLVLVRPSDLLLRQQSLLDRLLLHPLSLYGRRAISRLVLRRTDCHLWLRVPWSCLLILGLRLVRLLMLELRLLTRRRILCGLLILAAAWSLRSSELLSRLTPRLLRSGLVVHWNLRDRVHP